MEALGRLVTNFEKQSDLILSCSDTSEDLVITIETNNGVWKISESIGIIVDPNLIPYNQGLEYQSNMTPNDNGYSSRSGM